MIDFVLIVAAAAVGGLWRLTDGGWHRLPYGSSLLGLLICLGVGYLAVGLLGLLPGVIAWRGLTQGYKDWNNVKFQFNRGVLIGPLAFIAAVSPGLLGCPLVYDGQWYAGLYLFIPLLANAVQPFMRHRMDNKPIEFMEGALVVGGLGLL